MAGFQRNPTGATAYFGRLRRPSRHCWRGTWDRRWHCPDNAASPLSVRVAVESAGQDLARKDTLAIMANVHCGALIFTGHAFSRMFARAITPAEVRAVVDHGETIAEYPDDKPYPSALLLGTVDGRVLHVVVGHDAGTKQCYVITVYEPDPEKWEGDFRRRKP